MIAAMLIGFTLFALFVPVITVYYTVGLQGGGCVDGACASPVSIDRLNFTGSLLYYNFGFGGYLDNQSRYQFRI